MVEDGLFHSTIFVRLRAALESAPEGSLIFVSGDSGTGKSTALRMVADLSDTATHYRGYPGVTASAALQDVAAALGLETCGMSTRQVSVDLQTKVKSEARVLLVDDVQYASAEFAEVGRFLSETPGGRCTTVLCGRPGRAWPKPLAKERPDLVAADLRTSPLTGSSLLGEIRKWDYLLSTADDEVLLDLDSRVGHGLLSAWSVIRSVANDLYKVSDDNRLTPRLAGATIAAIRKGYR